jgi:hypothetical protein
MVLIMLLKSFQNVCNVLYATTEADGVAKSVRKPYALKNLAMQLFTPK